MKDPTKISILGVPAMKRFKEFFDDWLCPILLGTLIGTVLGLAVCAIVVQFFFIDLLSVIAQAL